MTISIQRFSFHHRKFPISACCRSTSIIEYVWLTRSYSSSSFHLMLRPSTTFDCLLFKSLALACNSQTLFSFLIQPAVCRFIISCSTYCSISRCLSAYLFCSRYSQSLSFAPSSALGGKLLTDFLEHALDPKFYEELPAHRA